METLHTRLDYQKEAVLSVTEKFGRFKAMDVFKVRDYLCFSHWLREATGNENFGLNPKISLDGGQTLGDQVVDAFLQKVAQLQAENEKLHKEIEYLKWLRSSSIEKEELQALAVLEVCQA